LLKTYLYLPMKAGSSVKPYILPLIVVSQFFCTSLWFAGNAVMADLMRQFDLPEAYLAHLTSAVQLGFIVGTLVFAVLSMADRFSPSRLFFSCALLAAASNLCLSIGFLPVSGLISVRAMTGFFLAGIYPVGMKIAADYYQQGLGRSLGFLVGALVLGTAFPHFLKSFHPVNWHSIIYATSLFALTGGLLMRIGVADGPYRVKGGQLRIQAFVKSFSDKKFRQAAFGYFGHMWELYTFWAAVPLMLFRFSQQHQEQNLNIPLFSFLIIASGSLACLVSGSLSVKYGAKKIAAIALGLSGTCCLLSPLLLASSSFPLWLLFLLIWSMAAVADSPLLSTLVAQHAEPSQKGSAITIVNCIGFSITILSIQLLHYWQAGNDSLYTYCLLAPGPLLGLAALISSKYSTPE